jgi:VWFA-related protein
MRFGRMMLGIVGVACGVVGLVGRGVGRVEASDRTVMLAGQRSSPDSGVATLQVYSRETVVDVVAVDAKGKPVHGLKESDFTVEEDGNARPIRSFQKFGRDMPGMRRVSAKLPPNVYTNFQPVGAVNIILLDYVNNGGPVEFHVREEAKKYVKAMAPGTQVAVIGLSKRMEILQSPTSNVTLLLNALDTPLAEFLVTADACGVQTVLDRETLRQLDVLAGYMSGIKGRKNLIWIYPKPFTSAISLAFPNTCLDFSKELRMTYDKLEAAQVAIYPVKDGIGLGQGTLSMEAVAEETGGEAFYNLDDLQALMTRAIDRGANYYTLSYVPESLAYDGRYHSISVKVDRPDVRLIYRKGYSAEDTSPKAQGAGPTLMQVAMQLSAPTATQLLFDVRVAPSPVVGPSAEEQAAKDAGARRMLPSPARALARYDVLYAVPASQIAFAAGEDRTQSGSLEFDVAAYNAKGDLLKIVSQTLKLPLTAEEYGQFVKTPFQFFQQIDLPPGKMTVRVGVLDGVSNKVGTMEIPVDVAKGAAVVAGK